MSIWGLIEGNIKRFGHTPDVDLQDVFSSVAVNFRFDAVSADFYPYAELKHTWKVQGHSLSFKVSDYLADAPQEIVTSLAWYLLSKAVGRTCPVGCAEKYMGYARSKRLWLPKRDIYLSRSRSLVLGSKGTVRDLQKVFDYINSFYFSRSFETPTLAWTIESPRRRLGYYFEPIGLLAINRVLDSERVPRYALEFVMYHELLHSIVCPELYPNRRIHHTFEFKRRERQFRHFEDAQVWLRTIARPERH